MSHKLQAIACTITIWGKAKRLPPLFKIPFYSTSLSPDRDFKVIFGKIPFYNISLSPDKDFKVNSLNPDRDFKVISEKVF